ncbi:hypothetical protein HYT53_00815 [Candidatus Woesearchaeota archaeon]|nr:hypothetical protein [Candidatus Woesearchaeota archaeon]
MGKDNVINRDELKTFLEEARILKRLYDEENQRNPASFWNYGSVDKIMLRLIEDEKGFVAIGIKLHGDDIKVVGRFGHLSPNEQILYVENGTIEYLLKDFEGSTVSKFATSLSRIVDHRYDHGIPELKAIMLPNAKAFSARTRQEASSYSM